jgi:site-specific DNA-cytosine methylase
MIIFSAFDGLSGGQIALQNLRLMPKDYVYYRSEIDKYANVVAESNFPNSINLGDIKDITAEMLPSNVDIMLAGSPCQGFSFAGKNLNFEDPRSQLFFVWVKLLKEIKPKYFLFENVRMSQKCQDVISQYLGVKPVKINSSLVSAQNRVRLYWTNIPMEKEQPQDLNIMLSDILENGLTDRHKSHCIDANYFKGGNLKSYFQKHRRQLVFSPEGLAHVSDADINGFDAINRVYHEDGNNYAWRKLTPLECERLQTIPENYTNHVSNTQRYKMLGNGWTIKVIEHILHNIIN